VVTFSPRFDEHHAQKWPEKRLHDKMRLIEAIENKGVWGMAYCSEVCIVIKSVSAVRLFL